MISQIRLTNFKCFKEETIFPLSQINLLTGINGRGKSTLLQSLLLMRQSIYKYDEQYKIILNGDYVNLGSNKDIINAEMSVKDKVELGFRFNLKFSNFAKNVDLDIDCKYLLATSENNVVMDIHSIILASNHNLRFYNKDISSKKIKIVERDDAVFIGQNKIISANIDYIDTKGIQKSEKSLFDLSYHLNQLIPKEIYTETGSPIDTKNFTGFDNINYISANRIGPQDFYKKINHKNRLSVDREGANVADVISKQKENLVADALYLGKDAQTLQTQLGEWLGEILDTPNLSLVIDDYSNDYVITMSFKIGPNQYKPINMGFGYSYILPILVAGLMAKQGEVLIIENPEAHLHPKAQGKLTQFLSKVAGTGVQVFIESHSEHILNALRVIVKEKEVTPNDVSVLYFQEDKKTPFISIPIQENGGIEVWPDGFFDQTDKDYKHLFGF